MRALLAALVAALPLAAVAQPALQPVAPNTVTVTGEAFVSAPPDRAVIRLGVLTRGTTAAAALREHEADMARVLGTVRSYGIADRQISVEALNLGDFYGPEGPSGFQAYRIVAVTVDSLAAVPDLVASVVESGANRLEGVAYTLSETAAYRDRALDGAVADARRKAERLAAATGRRLGGALAIQEAGAGLVQPYERVEVQAVSADAAVPTQPGAYSAGSSRVRASVVVQYALAD